MYLRWRSGHWNWMKEKLDAEADLWRGPTVDPPVFRQTVSAPLFLRIVAFPPPSSNNFNSNLKLNKS